ncbi:MAG: flavin reductase family protein [Pseudomonadota bacterium]
MKYTKHDLQTMQQRYRAHFVNSLSGYKSANVIGTQDDQGFTNAAIVSSVIHLGADPALIAFINRPHTAPRHTLENIYATGVYTINQVTSEFYENAHHTAARYERDQSEFDMANIAVERSEFPAPYLADAKIKMGIRFCEAKTLEINQTVLVIGEIEEVILAPEVPIADDGKIDISAPGTICISGLDEYHTASSLGRLAYAKPVTFLDK